MVHITMHDGVAVFEIEGIDNLWSLRSRLEIPVAHIRGARIDPEVAHGWWHGFRLGGTALPGVITAGRFYQHGKLVFWDVHIPDRTIVVELHDERYDELIIEVADPERAIALIHASIA